MSQYDDIMNKKAVALRYDENRDVAPVIVASGLGYMAEKIVEMANENGVPVYEDNSLATVLTQLDLGTYFLKYTPKHTAAGEASVEVKEVKKAEEDEEKGGEKDAK